MKSYIIYHNADNDGFCSGYIAYKALPNAMLIGYNYGDSTDEIDKIPDGSKVIMLDISLSLQKMIPLSERTKMTWIDHHKNTYEEFAPHLPKCEIIYGEIAACRLAWGYFLPEVEEPTHVKLTGQYDVFDRSNMVKWENVILPFEYGLRSLGIESAMDYEAAVNYSGRSVIPLIREGSIVLRYLQNKYNKLAERAVMLEFLGYKAMVISAETGAFWYKTPKYIKEKPDILVFPRFSFVDQAWKISLREGENKTIDCAKIAKSFGGGGHAAAAGFRAKELSFLRTLDYLPRIISMEDYIYSTPT